MLGSRSRGRRRNAWVALGWLVLASWQVASSGRDAVADSAYRNDEVNVAMTTTATKTTATKTRQANSNKNTPKPCQVYTRG
jgi:hypothetical protein